MRKCGPTAAASRQQATAAAAAAAMLASRTRVLHQGVPCSAATVNEQPSWGWPRPLSFLPEGVPETLMLPGLQPADTACADGCPAPTLLQGLMRMSACSIRARQIRLASGHRLGCCTILTWPVETMLLLSARNLTTVPLVSACAAGVRERPGRHTSLSTGCAGRASLGCASADAPRSRS